MIFYSVTPGVKPGFVRKRPFLSTQQGGRIVIDTFMLSLWEQAQQRSLQEILEDTQLRSYEPEELCAALACLAEAGLLERRGEKAPARQVHPISGELVSIVIVGFNSREWLENCLPSLYSQTYSPLEVLVVDNASSDGTGKWLADHYPQVTQVSLSEPRSLAFAINRGVEASSGEYMILLNPDVQLEADAVARMVEVAGAEPACGAVAARLMFSWAPGFLNGLGNYVGAFSWGTDIALGHLDLGQFHAWREVPSACFAAALIPRPAWRLVGALDEGFPLYYEDSDWSYRARLLGLKILAAPQATIYHAFSGRVPSGGEGGLSPRKLRRVLYGRLRFSIKILGRRYLARFLRNYLLEDGLRAIAFLLRGRWRMLAASLGGWIDCIHFLPELRAEREALQARRVCPDEELFRFQRDIPVQLVWNGLPQLTWDIVRHHYCQLLMEGRTRRVPEFVRFRSAPVQTAPGIRLSERLARAAGIWRSEGFSALLHRTWRYTQSYLMRA